MSRILIVIPSLFILITAISVNGQEVFSGKSQPTTLTLTPQYERGLPPILYAELNFEDDNNNLILEANERAALTITIRNEGKGRAQGLTVSAIDKNYDQALKIGSGQTIPFLLQDQFINVTIPFEAGMDLKSGEHKIEINVKEYFGYDMDPAYLYVNTIKFQAPQLAFSGLEVVDIGEGTAAIREDQQVQAGELVKVKITVQNVGQNISRNTRYFVRSHNENLYVEGGDGILGDMGIGEVKEFWVTISPNKRVTGEINLPLYLSLSNQVKRGELIDYMLPLKLDQQPSEPMVLAIHADIDKLYNEVARFEVNSNRMKANVGNIIDIRQVPPSKMKQNNAIAVVIGVEKYDHFVPAPYAENDASLMQDYIKSVLGIDKVYTYKSKDVTGYFFDNLFNPNYGELQKAISKGETDLFIFYSGHGIPSKDGTQVFLIPSDGRIEAIERQGFEMNKFYEDLLALGARSVTIIMDACFSGSSRSSEAFNSENLIAMKGVRLKPLIKKPWEENSKFTVFSSSDFDQTSLAFDQAKVGLFTYWICVGLQGKADLNGDKQISMGELSSYVKEKVEETSVKIRGLQEPQFHGNAEMILAIY